jgi:hypothetical protein
MISFMERQLIEEFQKDVINNMAYWAEWSKEKLDRAREALIFISNEKKVGEFECDVKQWKIFGGSYRWGVLNKSKQSLISFIGKEEV